MEIGRGSAARSAFAISLLLLVSASVAACEGSPPIGPLEGRELPIYYGTRAPEAVEMTDGQILALGWLHWRGSPSNVFCTATLIAPRVVITAQHCFQGVSYLSQVGFGVGPDEWDPVATFSLADVTLHSQVDAAVVVLSEDATTRVPGLQPIPVRSSSPQSLVGTWVQVGGYGETHDGSRGQYFASVMLDRVGSSYLEVDGRGQQGLCFGDSGGPVFGPGPVVMGVESAGDSSCVGQDSMTRLDVLRDWIEDAGGSLDPGPDPDPDPNPTGCGELDYLGRCDGTVAEWCERDQIARHDCADEGKSCGYVDNQVGYYCVDGPAPDPCGGVDPLGQCDGDVARWCENGQLRSRDCGAEGYACAWVDDETGYFCVERTVGPDPDPDPDPPATCTDADTGCQGPLAVRCYEGSLLTEDCPLQGRVCEETAAGVPYCVLDGDAPPDGTPGDPIPIPPTPDPPDDGAPLGPIPPGTGAGEGEAIGFGGCAVGRSEPSGVLWWGFVVGAALVLRRRRPRVFWASCTNAVCRLEVRRFRSVTVTCSAVALNVT